MRVLSFLLLLSGLCFGALEPTYSSEDGRLGLRLHAGKSPGLTLLLDGREVLGVDNLMVCASRSRRSVGGWVLKRNQLRTEDVLDPVPTRNARWRSRFRELVLQGGRDWSLTIRLYNRALAYRFSIRSKGLWEIRNEAARWHLDTAGTVCFPEEKSFQSHFEGLYQKCPLQEIAPGRMAHLPLLVKTPAGVNLLFNEADVVDYPCLFLKRGEGGLENCFPGRVLESRPAKRGPDRNEEILADERVVARVEGPCDLPWRVVSVSDDDRDLLGPDLVYALSRPGASGEDWSWIRPGKVAWDWWNANNLSGVPFTSGINTRTYMAFIDFAADYGLEYVILDEGWSRTTWDVLTPHPDMDVAELIRYGRERGVGLILWLLWKPLDRNMGPVLDTFASWGVKGIKVDFMQRADQDMVRFYARVAREAARRHLLVDFHGSFKPTGLRRSFPNVLSYEGVRGLEHAKWSADITPGHDLLLPFIRMSAGPMDYTPGAMSNAGKGDFLARYQRPMSQGTRVHQLALYVIFESPLQMLCDAPTAYRREERCARFISRIPTTWDETRALVASVGEELVLARRKGPVWYLAALTNWSPRSLQVPLSFLPQGPFRMEWVADGPNAGRMAEDHRWGDESVDQSRTLTLDLAPGGGWAGILRPEK